MPQEIVNAARDAWTVLASLVAGILWLGRLEWRSRQNSRDILGESEARKESLDRETLDRRREMVALEKRLLQQRTEDREHRTQIWGEMNGQLDAMRRDISELLKRWPRE